MNKTTADGGNAHRQWKGGQNGIYYCCFSRGDFSRYRYETHLTTSFIDGVNLLRERGIAPLPEEKMMETTCS